MSHQQQFVSLSGSPLLSTCLQILLVAHNENNNDQNDHWNHKFMTAQQLAKLAQKILNDNNHNDNSTSVAVVITPQEVRTAIISNIRHYRNKSPFREFWNRFCASQHELQVLKNSLISPPLQLLGMTLLTSPVLMWYIARDAETNFLEIKPSTIPGAGNGLFCRRFDYSCTVNIRSGDNHKKSNHNSQASSTENPSLVKVPNRSVLSRRQKEECRKKSAMNDGNQDDREGEAHEGSQENKRPVTTPSAVPSSRQLHLNFAADVVIPQGTIIGEYFGVRCKTAEEFKGNQIDYAVKLKNGEYIVAVDERGSLLCWCAAANDNGLKGRNVVIQEFSDPLAAKNGFANRAFYVSTRDIRSGEEIFVTYGADFWGAESYDDIKVIKVGAPGPTKKNQHGNCKKNEEESEAKESESKTTRRRSRSIQQGNSIGHQKNNNNDVSSAMGNEFKCRFCNKFYPNYLSNIHSADDHRYSCPGRNNLVVAKDDSLKVIKWLTSHHSSPCPYFSSQHALAQLLLNLSLSSPTSTPFCLSLFPTCIKKLIRSSSLEKLSQNFVSTLTCLPKNEFTSFVDDSALADGLVEENGKNNSENKEKRRDWCLRRAMAFYGWNKFLSHEIEEQSSDDGDEDAGGDDGENEGNGEGKNNGHDDYHQISKQHSMRRATTLPLLRESLSFGGAC